MAMSETDQSEMHRLTWDSVRSIRVLGKSADGEWCFVGGLGAMGVGRMWQESRFCKSFNGFDTDVVFEKRGSTVAVPEGTPDTITITISREDAEDLYEQRFGCGCNESGISNAVENACRAALEGER